MKADSRIIHVAIADDHILFRQCLRKLLETETDIEVVAEFSDGHGVRDLIESERPDLLLLDLGMPNVNGLDVLRQLRAADLHVATVVLTASQDRAELVMALELGANAVVPKDAATRDLLKVMRQVHRGFPWPDRAINGAPESAPFAASSTGCLPPRSMAKTERWDQLTPRETEIALLVGQGLRYKEMARQLAMSSSTLNNHLRNIFEKLQINGRVELALHGRRHSS
jgi:two-component system nitrate/nitrite response regulator NarL